MILGRAEAWDGDFLRGLGPLGPESDRRLRSGRDKGENQDGEFGISPCRLLAGWRAS